MHIALKTTNQQQQQQNYSININSLESEKQVFSETKKTIRKNATLIAMDCNNNNNNHTNINHKIKNDTFTFLNKQPQNNKNKNYNFMYQTYRNIKKGEIIMQSFDIDFYLPNWCRQYCIQCKMPQFAETME